MKEFMMIFRHRFSADYTPSKDETEQGLKEWQSWIGTIAAQVKLVSTHQLGSEAKILGTGTAVADGPYGEQDVVVGGNMVVKAHSLEEAVEMAKSCPILQMGGNVEVRNTITYNI